MSKTTEAELEALPEIPGYEVLGIVGQGGMSVVYQARQLELARTVAIKLLHPHVVEAEFVKRLEVEGQAIAKLQHPHIAQIFDVGHCARGPYLALEFLEGETLHDWLQGPMSPVDAAKLLMTLARAVDYSHSQGVIHRDLKPGNVLFDSHGEPKIVDFGLAKLSHQNAEPLTRTGAVMGTPAYMAPEQASGVVKNVGRSCDIYALGSILYELIVGRPPFLSDQYAQTLIMVLATEPVPPRRLQPRVPRDLETICLKCLQKRPRRRYDSAGELAKELERFLEGRPIRARRISWIEKSALAARRRPVAAAAIAGCILLAILLIASGWIYNGQLQRANRDMTVQRDRSDHLFQSGRSLAHWVLYRHSRDVRNRPASSQVHQDLTEQLRKYLDDLQANVIDEPGFHDELASAYEQLALIQGDPYHPNVGKSKQAMESYLKALKLRKRVAEASPKDPIALINLAVGHSNVAAMHAVIGEYHDAIESLRMSQALLDQVEVNTDSMPTLLHAKASVWMRRGDVYEKKEEVELAESAFRKAKEISSRVISDSPTIDTHLVALSRLVQLSLRQVQRGNQKYQVKAKDYFAEFQQRLVHLKPIQFENSMGRAIAHALRISADFLRQAGKHQRALEADLKILELFREQSERDPSDVSLVRDVALSLTKVGTHYQENAKYDKAEPLFQESLQLTEQLATRDPENLELMNDAWVSHYDLGTTRMFLTKLDQAEPDFLAAIELARKIISTKSKTDFPSVTDHVRLAESLERHATLLTLRGKQSVPGKKQKQNYRQALALFNQSLDCFERARQRGPLSSKIHQSKQVVERMAAQLTRFFQEQQAK